MTCKCDLTFYVVSIEGCYVFFSCYACWGVLFSVVCVISPLGINHVLIINLIVHLPVLSSFSKI